MINVGSLKYHNSENSQQKHEINEPNSSRNVTKNYSSLKPPTQPKPLKVSEDPGDMARQQMRNQRIIS